MNYANRHGYSDIHPYEIVWVVSDKCVEVRRMEAVRDPDWKPVIIPGGFAGHCVNQESQRYSFHSLPESQVFKIRKHKNGKWKCRGGGEYRLSDKPRRFHDYNF